MFKYQTYFEKLQFSCPPQSYTQQNRIAFRWVFDADSNENFKPVYFKNPKRFNEKSDEDRCMSMGLSFFDNVKNSEERFLQLKKRLGQEVYKILGTQIAEGQIVENDGVNSLIDSKGHFTHHPTTNFQYQNNMIIVKYLK